jgi:hypothetical protein
MVKLMRELIDYRTKLIYLEITARCAQTQTKRFFESAALQHFQKISCGSFDR